MIQKNIKKRMIDLDIERYEDLANISGIPRATLYRYMSGSKIPDEAILKLAVALQSTPNDLLGWEEYSNAEKTSNRD